MGWQLLRAYRDQSGQPKQRLMFSLGCVDLPVDELQPMAKAIERHLCAQDDLFGKQAKIWRRYDALYADHRELFGCYALRTDRQDFTAAELWRVYMTLTQAEEGFRALKTDLGLRPNFHHREDRVDGHIFITVLAYHLWKWIRQKFDEAGERRDRITVRRVLETHSYSTLSVPAEDGTVHHLRKAGRPEAQQQAIYDMVGLNTHNLPKSKIEFQRP